MAPKIAAAQEKQPSFLPPPASLTILRRMLVMFIELFHPL